MYTAVKTMKNQHLVKVRSLPLSPRLMKMSMESIYPLTGEPATEWTSINSVLIQENVIPTLINFSTDYADMLKCVDPLQQEMKALEAEEASYIKADEIDGIIHELENSIAKYKEEYAILTTEANAMKGDLTTAEAKVGVLCLSVVYKFKIHPKMLTNLKRAYKVAFSVEVWQIVFEFHEQFVS